MIACLGVRIPIPLSISKLPYFLYVCAHCVVNQGAVSEILSSDTIEVNAPRLESYDGSCINVY